MKIGIDFSAKKESGGAYQYALSFLDSLKNDLAYNDYIIFNYSLDLPSDYRKYFKVVDFCIEENKKNNSQLKKMVMRYGYRILLTLRLFFIIDHIYKFIFRSSILAVKEYEIGLMIFTSGSSYGLYLDVPYLAPIHDLAHRKTPQFLEVSAKGRFQSAEHCYKSLCSTAKMIFVDSQVGKQDVINYYGIDASKVVILPFLPPNYLDENLKLGQAQELLKDYNLPENFVFYPAQFWPHKNHISLVKAIKHLKDKGIVVNLVFSGTKKEEWGEYDRVFNFIKENNLENQVWYLGYVNNQTMSALYTSALAMAMPTFFGPTNIPVLEAWKMHCPVLYSDIDGCREQLGDAGLLIDPTNHLDIADKLEMVWTNENLRKDLIEKGVRRLNEWTYTDFSKRVIEVINFLTRE